MELKDVVEDVFGVDGVEFIGYVIAEDFIGNVFFWEEVDFVYLKGSLGDVFDGELSEYGKWGEVDSALDVEGELDLDSEGLFQVLFFS